MDSLHRELISLSLFFTTFAQRITNKECKILARSTQRFGGHSSGKLMVDWITPPPPTPPPLVMVDFRSLCKTVSKDWCKTASK